MIAPAAHKLDAAPIERGAPGVSSEATPSHHVPAAPPAEPQTDPRLDALEAEVAELKRAIKTLAEQAGVIDPFAGS
jgi:hypothetical protein